MKYNLKCLKKIKGRGYKLIKLYKNQNFTKIFYINYLKKIWNITYYTFSKST